MRDPVEVTYMNMARAISKRATCARRQVGCILVDELNHVLATGFNGVATGLVHCIDEPCPGVMEKSGQGLDKCQAIHAEQNALLQCADVMTIHTAYVTTSPCVTCTKLLMNTSCRRIVYGEAYSQPEAEALWAKAGGGWTRVTSAP